MMDIEVRMMMVVTRAKGWKQVSRVILLTTTMLPEQANMSDLGKPMFLFPAFFLSIGLLIALHIKRKETPINLILLAAFTVVEAYTVGVLVTFFDQSVVIQAFFLTAAVVIGLTAFTFQTKHDFSNWYAALFTGLLVLMCGGFLQIFLGNEMTDTALAVGGAFLFSMFIIVDTQMIMTRLSAEEYIL